MRLRSVVVGLQVVVVLLCISAFGMQASAAGVDLPVEGGSAVWLQPLDGTPGSMGAAIALTLPEKIVGETVADLVKFEIVIHPEGGVVRIDPGLSVSLKTEIGIPVKFGLVALPLTQYKVGYLVGAQIFQTF